MIYFHNIRYNFNYTLALLNCSGFYLARQVRLCPTLSYKEPNGSYNYTYYGGSQSITLSFIKFIYKFIIIYFNALLSYKNKVTLNTNFNEEWRKKFILISNAFFFFYNIRKTLCHLVPFLNMERKQGKMSASVVRVVCGSWPCLFTVGQRL